MNDETTPAKVRLSEWLGQIKPIAWDYYHKRLMGAPGETRHHVYWTADYVGRDSAQTGDLEWLLAKARDGKPHVELPIWVRPMYYGEDVEKLLSAECERLRADRDCEKRLRKASDDHATCLREALTELRDRIKDHPAYADLTEAEEIKVGGDTAELSYMARVADDALGPNV